MSIHWQNLLARAAFWLCAEITFTLLGLDNLADYSEFIFHDRHHHLALANPVVLVTAL